MSEKPSHYFVPGDARYYRAQVKATEIELDFDLEQAVLILKAANSRDLDAQEKITFEGLVSDIISTAAEKIKGGKSHL